MDQAKSKYLILTAMQSAGNNGQVSEVLKRMFAVMPKARSDSEAFVETWLAVLSGQPLASIYYAFLRFVKDSAREFAPSPGQFLAVVEEHARRVKHKADTLAEAIANEVRKA